MGGKDNVGAALMRKEQMREHEKKFKRNMHTHPRCVCMFRSKTFFDKHGGQIVQKSIIRPKTFTLPLLIDTPLDLFCSDRFKQDVQILPVQKF